MGGTLYALGGLRLGVAVEVVAGLTANNGNKSSGNKQSGVLKHEEHLTKMGTKIRIGAESIFGRFIAEIPRPV